ncbi:MAG: CRISPR-associated protein Cas4 [Herpetosiphon sp.]|nr:CRISPR-associated protein Cas4 [Herpetosiphon sp.]
MNDLPDYIPLAMLNALAYCARRFGYEYLQSEMLVNEFVAEGKILHERVDAGGKTWLDQGVQERSLWVWNAELGIAGKVDVLESRDGVLHPIEYKRGKIGKWRNDHVQLCAQALCLEAMYSVTIPEGSIFSWANRRREIVPFDAELRQLTMQIIEQAKQIVQAGVLPPPTDKRAKCRDCSLRPLCLPDEVRTLNAQ